MNSNVKHQVSYLHDQDHIYFDDSTTVSDLIESFSDLLHGRWGDMGITLRIKDGALGRRIEIHRARKVINIDLDDCDLGDAMYIRYYRSSDE